MEDIFFHVARKIEATTKLHLIYQNDLCLYLLQAELYSNSIYPIKCLLHNCWKYNYNFFALFIMARNYPSVSTC